MNEGGWETGGPAPESAQPPRVAQRQASATGCATAFTSDRPLGRFSLSSCLPDRAPSHVSGRRLHRSSSGAGERERSHRRRRVDDSHPCRIGRCSRASSPSVQSRRRQDRLRCCPSVRTPPSSPRPASVPKWPVSSAWQHLSFASADAGGNTRSVPAFPGNVAGPKPGPPESGGCESKSPRRTERTGQDAGDPERVSRPKAMPRDRPKTKVSLSIPYQPAKYQAGQAARGVCPQRLRAQ